MLGRVHTDLLVTVALLFLTQTGFECRAENDFSSVTLPELKATSDYIAQCLNNGHVNLTCDWTKNQRTGPEDVEIDVLESHPLEIEGKACLEFWYLAPAASNGSELRALLKSSISLTEIWTSPAVPRDGWRQVFVPLIITEPGTNVVFEAVQPVSTDLTTLKQIAVKQGSCENQCESNTGLWTDDSTHCICSGGQLFCFPSECPKDQICGPQTGSSSGISTKGMCTIHSHTDCSTFDGVVFRFMASCTYVLSKTCSPTETLPKFSVEVVNEQSSNASLPTVQQVIVHLGKIRVSLLKRQTHQVVINGVWKKLPLSLSNGTINIKSNPAATVLETSSGMSVSYDSAGAVHVTLPSSYSDKVCGICGNFNHLRGDDFLKPDGTKAENITALAKSWQTGETTSSCETILVPYQCDLLEEAKYASELYCGGLVSGTGQFASCLSVLGAESYFRACMVGMCSSSGDQGVLCETFQLYAGICQEAGVTVPLWRNSTLCPLQCGENSHYSACADGCPEVCSSLDITRSCGSCEERCECDPGFKLSGDKCVIAEDCGCWHKGKLYEKGETFMEGDCVEQCQCMGNNVMQCTAIKCADNEVCKAKDGVKGCFPFKPATCSIYGDPHYITFDKLAYDFQGGCSYTLTTTCGGESSVQFTVTGYNLHPPLANFTRSKLDAVALQVSDLNLTLNQSGEAYVHDAHVKLPYSTNGTYGSVWAHMNNDYIILETTFGLKMVMDGQNRLFLQVDERYKYELCGLCGTYSGYQDDDFIMPGGQHAAGPFEFGDSWRVHNDNECISHPNNPRLCESDEDEANKACSTVFQDAFGPCHEHVHPSIYLSSCVYDYCATSGDQHTLCESLKSYAAACQFVGVELGSWQTGTACANLPTTATPPTTPGLASPTPDQTSCPMNCNFDQSLCGWEQLIQDSFDWTRHSGPTPSNLTGPNQDHTSGAGFYMHLEGDGVTYGDSARLLSSVCHYDGPLCLRFWYHLYGSATGMALNVYLLKDNKATKLWSVASNQGPEWYLGNVDLRVSSPFQIIVEGIRGSTVQSDVAIDDVSINFGSCSDGSRSLTYGTVLPLTTAEVLPSHPICNLNCSFDGSLCNWNQMVTDAFDWTWHSGSTPTNMTGPSTDHTGGGHYVYIEANGVTHGDTARLISSECSDTGAQCLQFWYHIYGSADTMGVHVYLLQNKVTDAIWWKRNDQGNIWHLAQVDFKTTGAFQIIIEGRRGSNERSDVAIDDIKLYHGHCSNHSGAVTVLPVRPDLHTTAPPSVSVPTTAAPKPPLINVTAHPLVTMFPTVEAVTELTNENNVTKAPELYPVCQLDCDFEENLCQWIQLLTDVFDWKRHSGSTPTKSTGPPSDHTTGSGHYLYIEANSASLGDTARLISPECSDSGPQCLQFWYHIYGSADTMGLHIYILQDRKADVVWRKTNDMGNVWHLAQVDLVTTGRFKIIIEGRRGSNDQSDVAIDDLSLHHGICADLAKPPQPPSASTKPQQTLPVTFSTTNTIITSVNCNTETTAGPQPPTTTTTAGPQPPTTTTVPPTAGPQPPTTTTAGPQPPTTTTAGPQPPTTTTAGPQPPTTTTAGPQPPTTTTAGPQPPTTTTAGPQPPTTTTAGPQPPTTTTAGPQPPTTTTAGPQPPTTTTTTVPPTAGPQPPTTTTAGPQPPTTTTAGPQPPTTTTAGPQPPTTTTAGPQPPTTTTAGPQPPTTTTAGPQPPTTTTAGPQPPTTTTAGPQPPTTTTAGPQPPTTTTAGPQPPTTTTAGPQPPTTTTAGPQPPTTTTAGPQPPTTTTVPPTAGPQPPTTTTAGPQPPTTTTAGPQPPTTTTAGPQPPTTTTAGPQPPTTTTAGPQPPTTTTAGPQPPTTTTAGPQPPTTTTAGPQPPTTTTAGPQPPTTTTAGPQPPTTTTAGPQPPTTTTAGPQPPTTTTAGPQPPTTTTAGPQPPTTTTAGPQPPTTTTAGPQPPTTTTAGPQPPTTTTAGPQPPTTTTAGPQPPTTTTAGPQPPTTTTAGPQPPTTTTAGPQPPTTTTAGPQPPTTTTAGPQPPTTTTAGPQPPTTTTAGPQPPTTTTAGPQPPTTTTAGPQPPTTTTAGPQPPTTTTAGPQPPTTTTAGPQPPTTTTAGPQPPTTTTAGPQPPTTTTAGPQPPTTTTAGPQPQTTATPVTTPQLATTAVATPTCPENSHFTTCKSACSPTCTHLNGPPHCHDQGCVPGCVCDDGFVRKGLVCVAIQECGCVDRNGTKYQLNELWYTKHCSEKCECEEDDGLGKIDCESEKCDDDAICLQNEMGSYSCQSTGFSECVIKGDPEYKTFDEMKHDFQGKHSYVLVRTKNLPSNLPDVYIEVINTCTIEDSDSHESSEEHHSDQVDDEGSNEQHKNGLQEIKVTVYNHTVEFKKNRKLFVDGTSTKTPVTPVEGLSIEEHSSRIKLKTDFGLSVDFNGFCKTEIILPHLYKKKVEGLCGNFDRQKGNDLVKPDGSRAKSVQEFGESWRV